MRQPYPSDAPTLPSSLPFPSQPARPIHAWRVVAFFCLFAALIPETIATSSTSPLKMLSDPLSLPLIVFFYGTADLLIREALLRRRLGWASVVLLGIAFGFFNEGVIAGTWYTVLPTGYAYIGAIDLAWVVALTIFHTFVSVVLPIAFIDIVFPQFAGRSLLRRRGIVISAVLFFGFSLLVALMAPYRPYRLLAFLLALLLIVIALGLTSAPPRLLSATPPPRLWTLRVAGFAAMFAYFILIYSVPDLTARRARPSGLLSAQLVDIAAMLLFSAILLWRARRWSGRAGWSPRHTLALITGVLTLTILLSLLVPEERTLGEPLVTVPCFFFLLWLDRRLKKSTNAQLAHAPVKARTIS